VLRSGLASGRTAIGVPCVFDTTGQRTRIASEAPPDPPDGSTVDRSWRHLSRADRFAVWAAREAVAEAGLGDPGKAIGVYFGGSTAGMLECETFFSRLIGVAEGRPSLSLVASQQLNGPGDAVARDLGASGPVQSFSSACSSGAMAIAAAMDAIRDGVVDVAIAGGADSLCALTYAGFNSLRSVDAEPSKPFRAERAGLSLGEGAGVLVLESHAHAVDRGADILAEAAGLGESCDAHHMTAPEPQGAGAGRAMAAALADAGLVPGEVDAVNAHGTGTPHNDVAESKALAEVFGDGAAQLPVTAPKAAIGHVLGAAGALEAVVCVLGIRDGVVYPTPGELAADPDLGVHLVTGAAEPTARDRPVWISTNLAFGGANAALVIMGWRP
jgi:3-oxoacyl-[acyl-carrier-protein] synthase II